MKLQSKETYHRLQHVQRVAGEPVRNSTRGTRGHEGEESERVGGRVLTRRGQVSLHALESGIETSIAGDLPDDSDPVSTHQSMPDAMLLNQLTGTVDGARVMDGGSCSILCLHLDLEQLDR